MSSVILNNIKVYKNKLIFFLLHSHSLSTQQICTIFVYNLPPYHIIMLQLTCFNTLVPRQCDIIYVSVGLSYKRRTVRHPNLDVATISASATFTFDWHKDTWLIWTVDVRSGLFTGEVSCLLA